MRKYGIGFFHGLIITSFSFLLLNGCGYKGDPYWVEPSEKIGEKNEKI